MQKNNHGFTPILLVLIVIVVAALVGLGIFVVKKTHIFESAEVKVGSELAGSNCSESGPVTLTVSPMKAEDISSIIPYGWMVNQHVTPIDHQYFTPINWDSPRDSYEGRAPADGYITQIQHRTSDYSNFTHGQATDEYRIVIEYTCTFLSYFDLITSLSPDIQSQLGTQQNANVHIPIKAGQVIGKIGGQTLDFAVWDTTKTLSGFLVPEHYSGEPWKIHTADPLDYASPELKAFMLSFNPRKTQPVSGKIDYDIDGTLAGNWFLKGQGGYTGQDPNNRDGWRGQFAFAPNNYDPTLWEISSGAWGENGDQFTINPIQPKPDSVGVANGLVKYELYKVQLLADGKLIHDERTINGKQNITAIAGEQSMGCMLVKLTAQREMQAEGFPGQSCKNLNSFDDNAKIYER
jgi:hypothetical protein